MFTDSHPHRRAVRPQCPIRPCPSRRRPPRAVRLLLASLRALAGHRARIVRHDERPWITVTLAGVRHTIRIVFAGDAGVARGESFIARLPGHEFAIPGHLVADAAIAMVEHRLLPAPRLVVEADLLVLEYD